MLIGQDMEIFRVSGYGDIKALFHNIAVPIQMWYKVILQSVGAQHAVPLRMYLT